MKIGILTFHNALNNGAVLQAYALQTYLETQGHCVEFINYQKKEKRRLRSFFAKKPLTMFYRWYDLYHAERFKRNERFSTLLKKGEKKYRSLDELQNDPPLYDVYIAGSDQIWSYQLNNGIDEAYYLNFGSNKTLRIVYAASLGQCDIPQHIENLIKDLLVKIDAISIRESNGKKFIQSLVPPDKKIYHLFDPTILLNKENYIHLLTPNIPSDKPPYIASYILSPLNANQLKIISYISRKENLELINLRNPNSGIRVNKVANRVVTPTEWIKYMYHSKLTICCSFHAVVFSLLFHKPFIVILTYNNQRIFSLLKLFGLSNRILNEFNQQKIDIIIEQKINWNEVDKLIIRERKKSVQFLNDSLKLKI